MKPSTSSSGVFKPFKNLKALLEDKAFELQPAAPQESKSPRKDPADRPDHLIFEEAMADVKPISRSKCAAPSPRSPAAESAAAKQNPEQEAVTRLKNLVQYGAGFVVSLTPEYEQGMARDINPEIARRLHRGGDFSIQDHIDLHGLRVPEAHEAVDCFLNNAILSNKPAVLIIHGRGLSSPAEPILKNKVYRWLTTSPWHKWIIAFTSARLCDGGAGATYVLLRRKPLKKRFRKPPKKSPFTSQKSD